MTTRFVQVSWGLEYTEVFLNIDKIKAYIQSYQNGVNIDNTTKMSERIALSAQDRMDEEIHQHIRISDILAKEELHDYLTGWINYFDSNLVNTKNIENKIHIYNENRLTEYNLLIAKEEEKFKQTDNYKKLSHLDFHETEAYVSGLTTGLLQAAYYRNKSRLEQYRKFFEAPDPDLIDIEFLPKYYTEIIQPIVSRCVKIAKKRLLYLKGANALKALPEIPLQKQPEITVNENLKVQYIKLKTTLTSGQILYLFKTLLTIGVIEKRSTKIDICRVIANSISSKQFDNLSAENLAKKWMDIDINDIAFWSDKFPDMANQVIKDNSNRIKYKSKKIR